MKNLDTLIDKWIGEEKQDPDPLIVGGILIPDKTIEAYNHALQDLKSRKQELIDGIVGIIYEEFKKLDDFPFGVAQLYSNIIKELTDK